MGVFLAFHSKNHELTIAILFHFTCGISIVWEDWKGGEALYGISILLCQNFFLLTHAPQVTILRITGPLMFLSLLILDPDQQLRMNMFPGQTVSQRTRRREGLRRYSWRGSDKRVL